MITGDEKYGPTLRGWIERKALLINMGVSFRVLGRIEEVLACYDQALQLNPGYAATWYNKGNYLSVIGRKEEAIVCYDRALLLNPGFELAWYNKGLALADLGRKEEAVACYDQAPFEIKIQ